MRKLLALAALLAAVALPSSASAQVFLGARLGYAIPFGDIMKDWPVTDSLRSQVPITLDLGLKLGRALAVGAYAGYGFGQKSADWKDSCDARNDKCSAAILRLGAQANLHAANTATTEFWGGLALGYQEARFKDSGLSSDITFKGVEGTIQGGFDFLASESLRVGPYASFTVARFNKVAGDSEVDIADKAIHGWVQIGVRGYFSL